MGIRQWPAAVLMATCTLAAYALLPSCQGDGRADWGKVQPAIGRSCTQCHEPARATKLIADVKAFDNAKFTEASFPDAFFPPALTAKSVDQIIAAGEVPGDSAIAADSPKQKAWVLHELHELQKLLSEDPRPDYSTAEAFNHFVGAGKTGAWEGCELAKKLDDGAKKTPEGMPPLWAPKLFELLDVLDYKEVNDKERQEIRDYVDGLLPGGIKACSASAGESS